MEGNMKIDLYTKAILTVIAIGIGCLVFEQKPVKEAHAAGSLEQRVAKLEHGRKQLLKHKCKMDGARIKRGTQTTDLYRALILTVTQDKLAWYDSRGRLVGCLNNYNRALSALALE